LALPYSTSIKPSLLVSLHLIHHVGLNDGGVVIPDADGEGRDDDGAERGKPKGRHPENRLSVPAMKAAGPGMHADGGGLYLQVDQNGARRWVLRTVVRGRRRDIGNGGFSYTTLAEVRETARRLRKIARSGGDPIAERDKEKRRSITFEEAARKVHAEHIVPVARNEKAAKQCKRRLGRLTGAIEDRLFRSRHDLRRMGPQLCRKVRSFCWPGDARLSTGWR
jgi:hypothetical protein